VEDNDLHMSRGFSKIHRRLPILAALITLIASGTSYSRQNTRKQAHPDATLKCADRVRLEGKLSERTFYGPPGVGTPAKEAYEKLFLLNLMSPITVQPVGGAASEMSSCSKTFRRVRQVQLFFEPAESTEAETMVGKVIVVSGLLDEAHLPSQHTDIIMDVETLSAK
jgi:hypothetical protein